VQDLRVALYIGYSSNVVVYFSDDLVNDQVSNPRNGFAPFPVYSSQSIVGWNTHFLFHKWEMVAPSNAKIVFVELHW
jgi:hypothetical protein